jgi:hypothetical protein
MMGYTCLMSRPAARSHVRKLQVLQPKCFRIATNAPCYVGNRQIHSDSEIPFFSDHIKALTESFKSKLADTGYPFFGNLEDTSADRGLTEVPHK